MSDSTPLPMFSSRDDWMLLEDDQFTDWQLFIDDQQIDALLLGFVFDFHLFYSDFFE